MNLLESKVIQTQFESEIYVDNDSHINIKDIRLPEGNTEVYQLLIGIEFIRLRDDQYYGTKTGFFGVSLSKDLQTVSIFEPEYQSIFSVKNSAEKEATLELIEYILTVSPSFKEKLSAFKQQLKETDVICEKDIDEIKEKLTILERLNHVAPEEINIGLQTARIH